MNADVHNPWYEANQRHLATEIANVRAVLERRFATDDADVQNDSPPMEPTNWTLPDVPAIESLCEALALSRFERKILLLCAGAEMDSRFTDLFARAVPGSRRALPTFSLALGLFDDAHWSALSPDRPLRRWSLIEVLEGDTLAGSPLRISERVLHFLAGVTCLDERLQGLVRSVPKPDYLASSHLETAHQVAAIWSQADSALSMPVVQLYGLESANKRPVAAAACALVGMRLYAVDVTSLPQTTAEIESFIRLWERESVLSFSALLLECDDSDRAESPSSQAILRVMESLRSPLMVSSRGPRRSSLRETMVFEVGNPSESEQTGLWYRALQSAFPSVNGEVEMLVSNFSLNSTMIQAAARRVVLQSTTDSSNGAMSSEPDLADRLWDACRIQARPRMDGLAQRLETTAEWDDLILPEAQKQILKQIAIHVQQRTKVCQQWGFGAKGSRGLGMSALFAGPSGTGKTMAAEVLARQIRLDLYRIDLSQLVSKYIGETEKNLSRVFDAAEQGSAILLFDEADALFGKRSEVKDSHDRYANIEISYLLQRMESYHGLAILTSNMKQILDVAFLRRLRFVVNFTFPDTSQRRQIWQRAFPSRTPTEGLSYEKLARLNVAGGNIRSIALNAAFLAADASEPVRMSHLLSAARSEFAKLEKPLTDSEIGGWV